MSDDQRRGMKHTGGCMCGEIRFECQSPPNPSTVCYCVYCRHAVGSVSVAWLTFKAADFAVTKGKPAACESSPGVARTFCGTCGTSLTYTHAARATEIDVTTGSMDHPELYPPSGVVMPSHRVHWDMLPTDTVLHDDPGMDRSWPQQI